MNDNELNLPFSGANHPGAQSTSSINQASDNPLSSSAFLDELRQDELQRDELQRGETSTLAADDASVMTFSYFSTWSSNYTMSNRPGPGRIIGNLYSKAGLALERRLWKSWRIGNRAALKEEAEARKAEAQALEVATRAESEAAAVVRKGVLEMLLSDDRSVNEKACEALFLCAQSDNVEIQIDAFEEIVNCSVWNGSEVRSAFATFFKRRKGISDVIAFSWKRPAIKYRIKWLYWYKLASRCLSTQHGSVIEAAAQLEDMDRHDLDFSAFEEIMSSCSDATDLLLAIHFIGWYWNHEGISAYVRRKGFDDPIILEFATWLIACWEIITPVLISGTYAYSPALVSSRFNHGMWSYLQGLEQDKVDALLVLEDSSRLPIWEKFFRLHHFLRSYRGTEGFISSFPSITKPWKVFCHDYLPNPEHAKLRERLLRLEDIHGPRMRKRFPPQNGSPIDKEE